MNNMKPKIHAKRKSEKKWNLEILHENLSLLFGRILDHNQQVVLVWSDHDLVLLGSKSEKSEIVLRIDVPDSAPCLVGERVKKARVLNCRRVVQRRSDRDAFSVDNNNTNYSFVGLNSLDSFFYF